MMLAKDKMTARELYEEVWSRSYQYLDSSSPYRERNNLWWVSRYDLNQKQTRGYKPFVLKMVESDGMTCSKCSWLNKCFGCPINASDEIVPDLFYKTFLAVEWDAKLLESAYNTAASEIQLHRSVNEVKDETPDDNELSECFDKLVAHEKIEGTDQVVCGRCREATDHEKKLDLSRLPPVLLVQLKRFEFSAASRRKIQTFVSFPLNGLDLTQYVHRSCINEEPEERQYDLFAVINHYGSLYGGHYVAVVKSEVDNKWYKYNDSSVSEVAESKIRTESAYILCYKRKDLEKKELRDVFPSFKK